MKIARINPNCMYPEEDLVSEIHIPGCEHKCKGCYASDLWDPNNGVEMDLDSVVHQANRYDPSAYALLGGDPLFNPVETRELVTRLKQEVKPIYLFTGYTRKEIQRDPIREEIFGLCDIVKTGRYVEELKQTGFPSSLNQEVYRK